MQMPVCQQACEEHVSWEVTFIYKDVPRKTPEEVANAAFGGLKSFGQACVEDKKFGTTNAVTVKAGNQLSFF